MKIQDVFPDAKPIWVELLNPGDTVAFESTTEQRVILSEVSTNDAAAGPCGPDGKPFDAQEYYLVYRPTAATSAPPEEPGTMVRILQAGDLKLGRAGDILTLTAGGQYSTPIYSITREAFAEHNVIWEQVWLTNIAPTLDAPQDEPWPGAEPAEPEPAPAAVATPPEDPARLIRLTGGQFEGAILRYTRESRHDFQGICTDGAFLGQSNHEIIAAGWQYVLDIGIDLQTAE